MLMHCPNCNDSTEIKIDRDSIDIKNPDPAKAKPTCQKCNKPVNLSSYVIRAMISQRDFSADVNEKKSFSFNCSTCNKVVQAVLTKTKPKKGSKRNPVLYAACEKCKNDLKLTQIMIDLLKKKPTVE